ncbi:inositol monophosphatase [Candidatus Micrarchaeota archaeon]|nr:inositol monophosphatase [Candidatus Micrarchaeota archaeon]
MKAELETAIEACKKGGAVLEKFFNHPKTEFIDKGLGNIVSQADLESEKIILNILKKRFPDYAFYSEEAKFSKNQSDKLWVIDPLDGTSNFSIGIPHFGISIALLKSNQISLGAIYQPTMNLLGYAERGKKPVFNRPAPTPKEEKPNKQTISIVAGYASTELQSQVTAGLSGQVKRILTQWAPSLDYLLLSMGKIDSIISLKSESEDQIAGLLIAQEAGNIIRTVNGKDFELKNFSELLPILIVSRNEKTFEEIRELVKEYL